MPNMGGPIATAGDLVFVGAAMDSYLRAFDLETGRELWKYKLPAGGQATPMTYRAGPDQRQYVVISAGGHGPLGTPRGDYVLAFALPPKPARGTLAFAQERRDGVLHRSCSSRQPSSFMSSRPAATSCGSGC